MDASCKIQRSIHDVRLTYKYVSRILGTYHKKTAVRKTSSRKTVSLNTEVYVQWLGKEVYERDIIENIKKVWTEEMGKKESELVDLKIYIKPEDNGAHYVINGDITGFIEL